MSLRPISLSIPSTTQLKVTFSSELSSGISAENFSVVSLNGAVDDLDVTGVTIDGATVIVKTRPQVSGNYYLLKFLDTDEVPFSSLKGQTIVFDSSSREIFFVGIENVNPFRDRMFDNVPDLFEVENTLLKSIISAQAEELYTAQKTIGEVLSNNYLCVDILDEPRTRSSGATDRMANENAYEITRVSRTKTDISPIFLNLKHTSSNTLPRSQALPVYPISLQQVAVEGEVISLSTDGNGFDGLLITLSNRNVIKLLSITHIPDGAVADCDGVLGTEYDVERYRYSIKENLYDQDYSFEFASLEDNQVLLSEFGNISRPTIFDSFIVTYLYKNKGRHILEDQVEVSRVENSINESVPTNSTSFFLDNAPIVSSGNAEITFGGVAFKTAENLNTVPDEFRYEIVFDAGNLPHNLGEFSINYSTGEVFLVGSSYVGEGTGRNNRLATYNYRKEFLVDLDYSIYQQDLVATPDRDLSNNEAEIFIRYEEMFAEGIDYLAKSHIEVMPEFVHNNLSQSFRIETKNAPITDVFRIFNQTTGEVYQPLFHTNTEAVFAGNRSPEIKNATAEEASFERVVDEELIVIGDFIIPAFNAIITSNISNNNIAFTPGIPAELISVSSLDYFFRETTQVGTDISTEDVSISFFGTPDANNLITYAGISLTSSAPTLSSEVIIGTRGFVINLDNEGVINNNHDSIGSAINTSIKLSDTDIFQKEKFFTPISINPGTVGTTSGGISKALTADKGTTFSENISKLRKVGDYTVDYQYGIMYVSVGRTDSVALGSTTYFHKSIRTRYSNIITASSVSKKMKAPTPLSEAQIVYSRITHDNDNISTLDLENTLLMYDGETQSYDENGDRKLICTVLDDYTVLVPHDISFINGIFRVSDLVGVDLKSSSLANRAEEYSSEDLTTLVKDGGRNLFDSSSVTFSGNVIDFKKVKKRRVITDGTNLTVSIIDSTASTFVSAASASGEVIFDELLNITKIDGLEVAGVVAGVGSAVVSIASGVDLTSVDSDSTDYLLDPDGNRFVITAVDPILSTVTVTTPAENNVSALIPPIDPLNLTQIVVKPTITFLSGVMTITIPLDSGLNSGDLILITYLTTLIPSIGTPLAVDYRFGFVFVDYAYVADEVVIWYEYGDNSLDWSISDSLSEGEDYFVTYKFGALREALRINFGSLTNIPFFQSFGVNTDRELYRSAIKGTLQSFPKGPTIPSYKELIKSFTKINPEIDELIFGNWILGRDYLYPGKVTYDGVLKFAEGKYDDGLIFNDDVSVSVPAISSISLDEGTIEAWVRPDWAGIDNDATLTFELDNIGKERIFLHANSNPFDSEHDWELVPSDNLVGSTDSLGSGVNITNYRSSASEQFGLDMGVYGIYKPQENLDRLINSEFHATIKIGLIGSHFNDLRKAVTSTPIVQTLCEGETATETYFIVGCHGPGAFVEGPWPITMSSPPLVYNVNSFIIADGERSFGISLNLGGVDGFKFEVSTISGAGISGLDSDIIPFYNQPHYTRGCKCTVINDIPELENFNELHVRIELNNAFDFTTFKSSVNILEDEPSVFVLVDGEGIFYEVVGFYDAYDNLVLNSIPDSAIKFAVKKLGINNPSLSAMGSQAINSALPSGTLRLLYKTCEIITKQDFSDSTLAFDFKKIHVLNWSNYHEYGVVRTPCDNLVDILIDGVQTRMFYTDGFYSCNLSFGLTVDTEDLKGILIGMLGNNILTNLELLRGNGILENRYGLDDVYIGREGYNPRRNAFSINREDYPLSTVGEPPTASTGDGVFIWFDELCKSPFSDESGQWIFRARASRRLGCPTNVIVSGFEDYRNIFQSFFPAHKFSGLVTTDGEFSSVSRSYREESQGGCDTGIVCNSTFRYCGNELLEDFGWAKLEPSDSDYINLILGGREGQNGRWRKHGIFTTSTSTGIYRMGPSADDKDCTEEDNFLGNVVYTENPCYGGDLDYTISLRVAQLSPIISSGTSGVFTGVVSGNMTGTTPIHINDEEMDFKVSLAISDSDEPLVLIIDVVTNQILDTIPYIWNDSNFHEYRVVKSEDEGNLTTYIDTLMVSQISLTAFATPVFDLSSDFINPHIGLYLFDSGLVDATVFHAENIPNIIDVDLIYFAGVQVEGDGYLEDNDFIINTDSRIEFCFNIDDVDGYSVFDADAYFDAYEMYDAYDAYDGYDGYTEFTGVDEMFITSDRSRYLIDTGKSESNSRFSIFKDGKGFLNFRIFNDNPSRGLPVGMFNLATSVKHFLPGELHHIAASWKLNTVDEKDEMHIFIDGQEAPNIFKFGGRIPVRISDKFRDVSKEVLYDFLVGDIDFCKDYEDGTISAGGSVFQSSELTFTQDMVGRSLIFTDSVLAPTLVGGEYIIKSFIDSDQVTLGSGEGLDLITFEVSTSDIKFRFPPTAGALSPILTDLRNSRLSIFRTTPDGEKVEMSGVFYTISDGEINIVKGGNVADPKFRVNLDTRLLEFVGEDSLCLYVPTVEFTDIDIHIETYGLNLENCRHKLLLPSSSYSSDSGDIFSGQSVIKSRNLEPVSLDDVNITRIIIDRTVVDIVSPIDTGFGYQTDFSIELENVNCVNNVSSQSGAIAKQNLGRLLSLFFDSDNVDFCEFDGYEDGYQDGYLDGSTSTITVYGTTTDGVNEETFFIDKNGYINGEKFFTSVTRIEGSLLVVDPDHFEAALIELRETNLITVSDNNGSKAEVIDYKSGHFIMTESGSLGTFPFELHAGSYILEYPAYLNLNLPEVGKNLHIGSDFNGNNQFGGIIDEFRIISEMSSDTRTTEASTSGTRSVTDDFNKAIPHCPDSQTLTLITFDNPIELQSRRLRNTEFLDGDNNLTYKLSRNKQESLLTVVNDSTLFTAKMLGYGFDLEEANKVFYEVHRAESGPIFNDADFYRNVEEFPKSDNSVNSSFLKSGNFMNGKGLVFQNNDGKFRKDEGTVEFWVSPAVDTFVDKERRYYVDVYSANKERIKSTTSTVIELPNAAGEIVSVKLLKTTKEFSEFYTTDEVSTILFDGISRSEISGVLEGGTGTDKDFGVQSRLSADGKKIYLAESLPGQNVDVIVKYIPLNSNGDRFSIFKNEHNQIVFGITAGGVDNFVSSDIDWKKNTWHRVVCSYRTGTSFDTMRIFVDGSEGGIIRYGTGLLYGDGYIYGQYIQGNGQFRNQEFKIPLNDEFKIISIGSDVFGDNNSRSRIDNVRFSRIMRNTVRDSAGNAVDVNYSSNTSTVAPVVEDDATTLIVNFDSIIEKIDKFTTVIDPKRGIYNFDIEVYDNFDKVIGVNDGEVEDLIVELVDRLKPAHTNALVKFTKKRC